MAHNLMARYDDPKRKTKFDAVVPVRYDQVKPAGKEHTMNAEIKRDVSKATNEDLITNGEKIDTNLAGKPAYTTIAGPVAAHGEALGDLRTANNAHLAALAAVGPRQIARDAARVAYVTSRSSLASAVEGVTRDPQTITEIGFELRGKPGGPGTPLVALHDFHATTGDAEGAMDLGWDRQTCKFYIVQMATSPDGPFTTFYTDTLSTCRATGLTPGVMYSFRGCAHGADGDGPWSLVISKRAP